MWNRHLQDAGNAQICAGFIPIANIGFRTRWKIFCWKAIVDICGCQKKTLFFHLTFLHKTIVKSARSIPYGPKHLLEIMYSLPTILPFYIALQGDIVGRDYIISSKCLGPYGILLADLTIVITSDKWLFGTVLRTKLNILVIWHQLIITTLKLSALTNTSKTACNREAC
jgi:hypothetical protein